MIAALPVFGLPKKPSDASVYHLAGTPKDRRSLQQSSATAFLNNRQKQATEGSEEAP